ncbi:MAG TPA: bifunctional oligoribonuclease/PAP phosphatase NrnA [Vicinamibacterales bacterium]|nr:bifunctional oligoribonuclease/PAP phosphatase NrnA [Vicinamibacterales bacterium]
MSAKQIAEIREAILQRQRFVLTSHARPDGDAIGSQLAMAFALRQLGKSVALVNKDPVPASFLSFPGVRDVELSTSVQGEFDAAIVMECGDLSRTGVQGFEKYFVINIDHHPGNKLYGALNWFNERAAACAEMVFDLVDALGVTLTPEIATHIYLAILTDTGGFHYSHISSHTFDICRRCTEAGARPEAIARAVYDNSTMGRLRLMGAVLHNLELEAGGRAAFSHLSLRLLEETRATEDDSDGLINIPLSVKEIQAVAFFKEIAPDRYRISMRSKGDVDVNSIAARFGGGGHKNAAGCSVDGPYADVRARVLVELDRALS